MRSLDRHRAWWRRSALGTVALAIAFAAMGLAFAAADVRRARSAFGAAVAEKARLARLDPVPSSGELQALEDRIAGVRSERERLLRELCESLETQSEAGAQVGSVDSYFQLATFAEEYRQLARAARIDVPEDARFGFATYASRGPGRSVGRRVLAQRDRVIELLECLFPARPTAIAAVRRTTVNDPDVRERAESGDFFELDTRLSAKIPGLLDADAYRVEFTGRTDALRRFLATLASADRAAQVCAVAAKAASAAAGAGDLERVDGAAVVAPRETSFEVDVEFLATVATEEDRK